MGMTLELPPELGEELTRNAEREHTTPEEHAKLLLSLATALLSESRSTPFHKVLRVLISTRPLDADSFASVFDDLLSVCVMYKIDPLNLPLDADFDLILRDTGPLESLIQRAGRLPRRRPTAMGSCAHLGLSSDQFAKEKQEEIAREERGWE
jgi:hypothetical protein